MGLLEESGTGGRGCFEIPVNEGPGVHTLTACNTDRNRSGEVISTDMDGFFLGRIQVLYMYLKVNALSLQCLSKIGIFGA